MPEDDVEVAATGNPGRLDEGFHFDRQGLGFDDDRRAAEAGEQTNDQGQLDHSHVGQGAEDDEDGEERYHDHQVRQAHQNRVYDASVVGGDGSDGGGDHHGHHCREDAQGELVAGAIHQLTQNVPPQGIGPQEMACGGWRGMEGDLHIVARDGIVDPGLPDGVHKDRMGKGEEGKKKDNAQPDQSNGVFREHRPIGAQRFPEQA